MYVCICGIFRLTKGSHSHSLAPPHPGVLCGLQPRGVGTSVTVCQPGLDDCFQRRDIVCLMTITQWVWFEEHELNLCRLGHLLI